MELSPPACLLLVSLIIWIYLETALKARSPLRFLKWALWVFLTSEAIPLVVNFPNRCFYWQECSPLTFPIPSSRAQFRVVFQTGPLLYKSLTCTEMLFLARFHNHLRFWRSWVSFSIVTTSLFRIVLNTLLFKEELYIQDNLFTGSVQNLCGADRNCNAGGLCKLFVDCSIACTCCDERSLCH